MIVFSSLILFTLSVHVASDVPTPFCPPGTTASPQDPNFCYFILNETNTFQNAEIMCQNNIPAHLPKINDNVMNFYIGELARSNGFDSIWIGATNTPHSKGETCDNWYWTNWTEVLSFTHWGPSEPSSGNCVSLSIGDGYQWHTRSCSDFLPTICQIPASYSICDPDWSLFTGTQMCYKTVINRLSFDDAEKSCQSNGGHLVSIHSEAENEFVINIAASGITTDNEALTDIYIGLYRDTTDPVGTMHWTDGTSVNYSTWT
ncbi:hypothetical protein FO519_010073, partial [Halicephalobus sp. NKZ332]